MWPYIAAGTVGALGVTAAGIRHMFPWLKYDLDLIKKMAVLGKTDREMSKTNKLLIDLFEEAVKKHPNKPFVIFEVRRTSKLCQLPCISALNSCVYRQLSAFEQLNNRVQFNIFCSFLRLCRGSNLRIIPTKTCQRRNPTICHFMNTCHIFLSFHTISIIVCQSQFNCGSSNAFFFVFLFCLSRKRFTRTIMLIDKRLKLPI